MLKHPYRVAVITASDKGAAGTRRDESGPVVSARMQNEGYVVNHTALLPDDFGALSGALRSLCDGGAADLILTTGGTGLAPRDCTPEATLDVAERLVPGIAEAMRAHSMAITPRGMLSRGVAAICGQTLIINLPGSPKAAAECLSAVLPTLEHALDTLCGHTAECARTE